MIIDKLFNIQNDDYRKEHKEGKGIITTYFLGHFAEPLYSLRLCSSITPSTFL